MRKGLQGVTESTKRPLCINLSKNFFSFEFFKSRFTKCPAGQVAHATFFTSFKAAITRPQLKTTHITINKLSSVLSKQLKL